jgi:lipopolysaccharide transport system permease protein
VDTFYKVLKTLWLNKRIVLLTTFIELKKRHAGSILGIAWIAIYPALLLSMYLFVYIAVFKVKVTGINSSFEYSLFVLAGIIPYMGFSEVLNGSVLLLSQNRHLITNVIIPMEVLPVRLVCIALVSQAVSLVIIMVMLLLVGGKLTIYWLWVPVMLGLEFLFLAGLAYIFSALGVLIRDLSQLMAILTLFLLFVSPVGYTRDMVPKALEFVLYFNPVYYLVDTFREPLLYGRLPELDLLLIYTVLSFGLFALGSVIFKRTLHTLSDLA